MEKRYKLPDMEYKFSVQFVGKESGINWVGDFTYKRPNINERSLIELMKTRLNGDLVTIDPDIAYLNAALAHLRFTLKSSPEWWKDSDFGGALFDTNVIVEIYKKCIDFETEWSNRVLSGKPEKVEEGHERSIGDSTQSANA